MKVIVEEKGDGIEFPCLMRSKVSDLIVIFSREQKGVVVYGGGGTLPNGHHSDGWDMDTFELFKDRLILEN